MKPRILIYQGRDVPAPDLAREKRIPLTTLLSRIDRLGWTVERAADTAIDNRFRRGGRRPKGEVRPCPPMKRHTNGQARARWSEGGKRREAWFGLWGSKEARAAYSQFSAEWSARGNAPPLSTATRTSVSDLCEAFLEWCRGPEGYSKHGRITSEYHLCKAGCVRWVELYGTTYASNTTPTHLRAVRATFVADGKARTTANRYANVVIRALSWGVGRELGIKADVLAPLREVEPLVAGRTTAHETEPITGVPVEVVAATIPHLHSLPDRRAVLESMVRVQLLTGVRPGELCAMERWMIDRTVTPWMYDTKHANKTLHLEKPRRVWIGPAARAILGPILDDAPERGPVWRFPPRGALGTVRVAVTRDAYSQFVGEACKRAGVKPWTPNQLRHQRANEVMDRYEDDEAVAAALGNSPEVARQVYTDNPRDRVAKRIAEATG